MAFCSVLAVAQGKPAAEAPLHRGDRRLPPRATFLHLQRGNELYAASRAETPPRAAAVRPRPAGAGTRLAVVFTCADAPFEPAPLLGVLPRDLLVLQSLGPFPGSGDVAALELAAETDCASLAVILVHETCPTLLRRTAAPTPAQRALQQRVAVVREGAERARLPLAEFHGIRLAEQMLLASEKLERLRQAGEFAFVIGVVEKTGAIRWVGSVARRDAVVGSEELHPAPPPKPAK